MSKAGFAVRNGYVVLKPFQHGGEKVYLFFLVARSVYLPIKMR